MNNQVKLIDAEKVFRWAELCVIPVRAEDIRRAYELGIFDPDTPPVPTIKPGDKALHPDLGDVVVVWVGDNIAEVATGVAHYDVSLKDLEVVE